VGQRGGAGMNFVWRNRRTLVTGATGIVGSWLCEELARHGAHVVAFVLDDDPQSRFYRDGIADRCTIVRGNLTSLADCMRAIGTHDIETIFHLGAQTQVRTALRDPFGTFESNIRGTYNLLEAARRLALPIDGIVVASSDKAYGSSAVLPYAEDMPLNGRHPHDVSKSCTDMLAMSYAQTYGLPIAVARCGNIYGGGDLNWSRIVPGTTRSLIAGERPVLRSDGKSIRDYVYVRDVVSAHLTLAERAGEPGVTGEAFNFSPELGYTVLEVVEAVGIALGVTANPTILDTATMEIRDQTLDATKARERLNWRPSWSLERGLDETVTWYRKHLPWAPPSVLI
jgi:CDP-glucose 4,6-dehydratase